MSIKCMARVWEYSRQKGSALLLLLTISDYAKDSGHAWPGIETIAARMRLSPRQTIRIIQKVEASQELIVIRDRAPYNHYIVNVWAPTGPDISFCQNCGQIEIPTLGITLDRHHITPRSDGGSNDPENIELLCQKCHRERHGQKPRDIMSRDTQGKQRDILGNLGDIQVQPGDIAMSPKPLITTIKPSLKPEEEGDNIFVTYEHEIGPLTPNVRDQLIDLEDDHSAHWTCEAIKIASTNGKRNLGYIRAILNRWHADGYGSEYKPANGSTPAGNKSAVTRRLEALKNGKR